MDTDQKILADRYKDYDFSADSDAPAFRETLEKAQNGDFHAMRHMITYYITNRVIKRDNEKAQYWSDRYQENLPKSLRIALEEFWSSEEYLRTPEL